jgi:hypothetical protein
MKLLITQFYLAFYYYPSFPLRSKYLDQFFIFESLQPNFFHCERPSFTPMQNNSQNFSIYWIEGYQEFPEFNVLIISSGM